jgi:hypothetical protein
VSPDDNCELDDLAGLLELMSDDADRARTAALLISSESLRSDGARDVYETICGALRDEQRPTMADLVRQPSYGSAKNRIADLFSRSISCRFGY